ncbi:hypothetical protein LPN01_15880 [Sphingomonas sp. A2-49]|uniref:hypothetical protein n=1 Tax=Sphingomonas sp. A2-49 TaxID=1391375 RepID=UPI0021D18D51|nr:hypothetical protein [Sphingomonas sp. A2-49]MCU6455559.1 hypothetical protein [Sphingomonas sp. A2-49]
MRGWQAIGAVMAAGMAMPATAQGATTTTAALAPGLSAPARGPLLQPIAIGSSVERTTRSGRTLRLRVAVVAGAPGPRDHVQQRIASSMIDVYPLGTSGFHLSAGTKMYDPRVGEEATNRGLMSPRRQTNIPGGRLGMRRTPAFTFGYTGEIVDRTTMGIEVGAMMGHAYNTSAADATRRLRGERPAGNPVNPMVNVVVGRRF